MQLDNQAIDTIFQCYQMTYRLRGSLGYLNRAFFEYAVDRIPESIRVAFAIHRGKRIAMSFCLRDTKNFYGRYWGALYEVDCLHFETCFHQWIEDAIELGGEPAADRHTVKLDDIIGVLIGDVDHGGSIRADLELLHIAYKSPVFVELLLVELLGECGGRKACRKDQREKKATMGIFHGLPRYTMSTSKTQ